jgi:hypothetical protein
MSAEVPELIAYDPTVHADLVADLWATAGTPWQLATASLHG